MRITLLVALVAAVLALVLGGIAASREPPPRSPERARSVDDAWRNSLPRDADAATRAYLERIPKEQRAKGDAVVDARIAATLLQPAVAIAGIALMLFSGAAGALRDRIKPRSRHAWLRDMLFSAPFLGLLFIIGMPVAIYAGFVLPRERGLSAVPFAQWLRDETLRFGVDSVFYVAGITLVLAFVRWRPRQWVAYAVAVYAVLSAAYIFVAPVAIEPLFNRFEPLPSGPGRDAILALARANGVDGADVVVRDASRQGRVPNANVTGMGGSARITLDDNTLAESSAPMFRLVMAHELGHFVLGHASKEWIARCLVMALGFAFAAWVVNALIARFGTRWGVAHVADVAAIPVFWGAFLAAGVVTLPLENGIHRAFEREADLYGLNASGEPHGLAEFMVQVSDAVKFEPSALEETLFHGHPAPASRVRAATRWRAEHLPPASRPVAP